MQGWIRIHSQTSTHPRGASTCIYVQTILKTFRVDVGTSNVGSCQRLLHLNRELNDGSTEKGSMSPKILD